MADTRTAHVRAVQADYDARSPRWPLVYDGTSFHDVVLQRRMAIAADMLARRDRRTAGPALDVGCGAGQLLEILSREGDPVAGVDVSSLQARSARDRLGDSLVAQADAGRLPFARAAFATVSALGLLEYLPTVREGLTEFARVAKPGGHVVVSVPNPLRLAYLCDPIGVAIGRLRRSRPGYRRHYRSARALRADLRACGLDVVEMRGHALGRFTVAGRSLLSDALSVRVSGLLERALPAAALRLLGSNLVAIARKA